MQLPVRKIKCPLAPEQHIAQGPGAHKSCDGITLVELVVTLCILATLATLAAPPLLHVARRMELKGAAATFFNSLLLARREAISKNVRTVLCKSSNGQSCANAGGWEQGWIVFHDTNNNAMLDANEPVLFRQPALATSIRFAGNSSVSHYVSFNSLGRTTLTSGAFQAGTLTICSALLLPSEALHIVISSVGRPRVETASVGSCA